MEATLTFISLTNYQEGTSAKGPWKKQKAVFETRDQYPKKIAVSAFNAMADTLAACTPQLPLDQQPGVEEMDDLPF